MGSGWLVAPGVVVTNAHVVAGQDDTRVDAIDGQGSPATPIAFNPRNDIAILATSLDLPVLEMLAGPRPGAGSAVAGYPDDGPLTIVPARTGSTRTVLADNAYGRGPFQRRMVALRGSVVRGNSGGPLLDREGRVAGTVFAATTEGPPGGLAVPNQIVASIVNRADSEVDTGPCAR